MLYKEFSEYFEYNFVESLGYSEKQFLSLPYDFQKAIIDIRFKKQKEVGENELKNVIEKIFVNRFDKEDNVKRKVLSIFKK